MNSRLIREISLEGTSGLWRVRFMEKKGFEARMKTCRGASAVLNPVVHLCLCFVCQWTVLYRLAVCINGFYSFVVSCE